MMDLKKLFKNHLNTNKISDDNMRKFAENHLERLAANNGSGEFTTMITDTTNAYTSYFGAMTNEDTKFAIQQGLTVAVNFIVESFKDYVGQKQGIIKGNFGLESSEYQEFFPQGVSEYRQANLANIELLMERIADAAGRHVAVIGAAIQTDLDNYLANFKTARSAQLKKIGEVSGQKVTTSTNRDVIEMELMKNVHLIAAMYVGQIDKCMTFFDQSFIRDSADNDEDENPPTV